MEFKRKIRIWLQISWILWKKLKSDYGFQEENKNLIIGICEKNYSLINDLWDVRRNHKILFQISLRFHEKHLNLITDLKTKIWLLISEIFRRNHKIWVQYRSLRFRGKNENLVKDLWDFRRKIKQWKRSFEIFWEILKSDFVSPRF